MLSVRRLIMSFLVVIGLAAAPGAARADILAVYVAVDTIPVGGHPSLVLLPQLVTAEARDTTAVANAILGELRTLRPTLYADTTVAAEGSTVSVTLGASGAAGPDMALAELGTSLALAGFAKVRVLDGEPKEWQLADVPYPVYRPVLEAWQALDVRNLPGALVRVGDADIVAYDQFRQRLDTGESRVEDRLGESLRSGIAPAQLAVVRHYEATKAAGRLTRYLGILRPDVAGPVKLAVLEAVAGTGNGRVLDAVARLAEDDDDAVVKSAAARVLVAAGRDRYKSFVLLERLVSPETTTVLGAIESLAGLSDPAVAGPLYPLLSHADMSIRTAAVGALGKLGAWSLLERAVGDEALELDMRLRAAHELAAAADIAHARVGLRFQLAQGASAIAAQAAAALGERQDVASESALVEALQSPHAEVRHAAARALGAIGATGAIEKLATLTTSSEDREAVEPHVVKLLASMSLDEVVKQVDSESAPLRRLALKSIAEFAKKRDRLPGHVLEVLRKGLDSGDVEIRRAAAYALARSNDAKLAAALLPLADDPDADVRAQVVEAATRHPLSGRDEILVGKLKDPSDVVKLAAIRGVRKHAIHEALKQLTWMIDYGKTEVRQAVVQTIVALAKPGDHEGLFDTYVRLLFDMDRTVRLAALEGIRVIQDPRVVGQLSPLVRDTDESVQLAAVNALGQTKDPRAVEPLAGALLAGSRSVKMAALDALGKLGAESAAKPLQEFLRNETDLELRTKAEQVMDLIP